MEAILVTAIVMKANSNGAVLELALLGHISFVVRYRALSLDLVLNLLSILCFFPQMVLGNRSSHRHCCPAMLHDISRQIVPAG
jgi:hypothetical protein